MDEWLNENGEAMFVDDNTDSEFEALSESADSGELEMPEEEIAPEKSAAETAENDNYGSKEEASPERADEPGEVAAAAGNSEQRRESFKEFVDAYPDVEVSDIPPEVFRAGLSSGRLKAAYDEYLLRELKKENESLRQTLKNTRRSTGSRKSAGTGKGMSSFDALWYDGT